MENDSSNIRGFINCYKEPKGYKIFIDYFLDDFCQSK